MHFLICETLSFNLMYVTACYPVGTTISKTSSHFTALLQHYLALTGDNVLGFARVTSGCLDLKPVYHDAAKKGSLSVFPNLKAKSVANFKKFLS